MGIAIHCSCLEVDKSLKLDPQKKQALMKERAEIVARAREPYKGMDQVTEEEIRKKVDQVRTGGSGCLHLNARSGDGASCHPLPSVIVCLAGSCMR